MKLECPSAQKLAELLANDTFITSICDVKNDAEIANLLKQQGVNFDGCNKVEVLAVLRDCIGNISDEELTAAAGGEFVKIGTAIAIAAGASTAIALGAGAGAGAYYATKNKL